MKIFGVFDTREINVDSLGEISERFGGVLPMPRYRRDRTSRSNVFEVPKKEIISAANHCGEIVTGAFFSASASEVDKQELQHTRYLDDVQEATEDIPKS